MFGFLRLFSIIGLVAVIVIATLGGMGARHMAIGELTEFAQKNNVSTAQGYVNMVWKRYRQVIVPLAGDPAQLAANPYIGQFAQETVQYFQGMELIRVNIYSAGGLLLMSNNVSAARSLMGDDPSPDGAFAAKVKLGAPSSQILESVRMQNADEGKLVQTIVPIVPDGGGAPEAALELLFDVTGKYDGLSTLQMLGAGGFVIVFLPFIGLMFHASQRAEAIIARQHEANMELAQTVQAAQAESKEKSQFLANISHELRTPLNAIIGFSDIIKTEATPQLPDKKYHEYISDIHGSGVHLLSLINDILDYSKAEAGKLGLEVSEVNASKLIQNCVRMVLPRAEGAGVTLAEELPKEAVVMITDGKKFKQVLLNLLSNAVKFTPQGGTVKVTAWENVADNSFSFEVKDSGIGISPKDISRAMAPFGQVDNTLKRKYEGTGLGLPLTKKFVELMGGKFNIESEMNVGTTITFILPREIKPVEGGVEVKLAS